MFICTYTNKVKQYCDEQYFSNLLTVSVEHPLCIVDNSEGLEYMGRICELLGDRQNLTVEHINIDPQPDRTRFLRCVAESANVCRDVFLTTDEQYFLIIESDVIPPVNIVELLEADIQTLPENWAALGALYYKGFHDYNATGIHQCPHTLSGCTVYSRKFIELFPFEWRESNLNAFPDAYAGINAGVADMGHYNDHSIHCQHLK